MKTSQHQVVKFAFHRITNVQPTFIVNIREGYWFSHLHGVFQTKVSN